GAYIKSVNAENAYIIGGSDSVNDAAVNSLKSKYGVKTTKRIAGANRYATSVAIYNEFKSSFAKGVAAVATGASFPDALAGCAFAARIQAPLLLLDNGRDIPEAKTALKDTDAIKLYIFGGESSLSDTTVKGHIIP
ncbi:MAG: cell wall-binding repeat-containing protein, partial [Oscillospiraceae bacterium]|nr:cell wall-binding repeat-containing protein [Oscillospiraceae bacterium]